MSRVRRTISEEVHKRRDVEQDDAQRRGALHPGGGDEVALADGQRLGPGEAGVGRPGGDRDGDDRVLDARAECRDEGQRQDQAREGQEHVGDPHQHGVEPAAGIARDGADEEADRADDHARPGPRW